LAHDHAIDQERRFLEQGFANGCELCKNSKPAPAEKKGDSEAKSKQA